MCIIYMYLNVIDVSSMFCKCIVINSVQSMFCICILKLCVLCVFCMCIIYMYSNVISALYVSVTSISCKCILSLYVCYSMFSNCL